MLLEIANMNRLRLLFVLGLIAALNGCGVTPIADRIAPETVQKAKTNFDYLRHAQYDRIEASVDASVERSYLRAELIRMAAKVPPGEPISVKTAGAYVECNLRRECDSRVTLEYKFPTQWALVQMVVHTQNGISAITSFWVDPESESMDAATRFTLRGIGASQYELLAAAIISILVMVCALVFCIRTPTRMRKWMWIVVILLAVGRIEINWATGAVHFHIFRISILSAWLAPDLYGDWILSVSLPIGAFAFLIFRSHFKKPDNRALSAEEVFPESGTSGPQR